MVIIHYETTRYGRRKRIVSRIAKDKVVQSCTDMRLTIPFVGYKGKDDDVKPIWHASPRSLSAYLTSEKPGNMRQCDKVCYDGIEFFLALPEEDPRTPG